MDERIREQNEATQPLAGGAPLGAQPPVVVEFEESARSVEPEREPASWPLRLLKGFFGIGVVTALIDLPTLLVTGRPLMAGAAEFPAEAVVPRLVTLSMALVSSAVITWLLHRRRRQGAVLAMLTFAAPFVSTVISWPPSISAFVVGALGIGWVMFCWSELE